MNTLSAEIGDHDSAQFAAYVAGEKLRQNVSDSDCQKSEASVSALADEQLKTKIGPGRRLMMDTYPESSELNKNLTTEVITASPHA